MNILVSGVAGDIGFGAGRILREYAGVRKLYGMDVRADHPGKVVFDECTVAPRADHSDYLGWLETFICSHQVDFFLPTSEAEIARLTAAGAFQIGQARVLMANESVVKYSLDKYECLAFLGEHGIAVPEHGLLSGRTPGVFPVIVKPRSGQGSKSVRVVSNLTEFDAIAENDSTVWQDYIGSEDEEYTCAVFKSASTEMRILVMKRRLQGGMTSSGEVVVNPQIDSYVASIAESMQLDGVMNVQLRMGREGPLLFEINPRLSSTLVFRHKLGFRDLEWWLQASQSIPVGGYDAPTHGQRFYRGAQEYFL